MNFSFQCPEDWFIPLCITSPGLQKSSTSHELKPDAKGWEFIDHDLWVVRQHYKVHIALRQIDSSVHMLFLASLKPQQRNLQSISFQETLLQEEAIWGFQGKETPSSYSLAIWKVPSLLEPDKLAELLLKNTIYQKADIHHVSLLRNNFYSAAKEMMPLAFSWREDIFKFLPKLTAVPFLKLCPLIGT